MDPELLPRVNAGLNALATVLLVTGVALVKSRRPLAHRRCMLAAFAVSAVFLVLYLTDKAIKGGAHTPFNGTGWVRVAYYAMLISHVTLAAAVPVFAVQLIRLGLRNDLARHRRLARVAFPIWLYVSITGVLIYFVLYRWNPAAG